VRDSLVNQLLAKIDGVKDMENVLVIGLTNRMDLIDPALIRPGRLEVHVEVKEPNEEGRREILQLHMSGLESSGRLGKGVWEFADVLAMEKNTGGYTGAELAGLVRNAASHAFERSMALGRGEIGIEVGIDDLERALGESAGAAAGGRFKRTLKGILGR
jgi:vesicle-fusing ATPase